MPSGPRSAAGRAGSRPPRPAASTARPSRRPRSGDPHGFDGGKLPQGRKRHIVVDTLGLLLVVTATAASADDGTATPQALVKLAEDALPPLKLLWADQKCHNHSLNDWLASNAWYVIEVVGRSKGSKGVEVIPRRWVVERTFAWLGRCGIHSRDYERHVASSEAQLRINMINQVPRRLAGEKYDAPFRYPRPEHEIAA